LPIRKILIVGYSCASARLLYERLAPDIVLPGASREFTLNIRHGLPAGSYTAFAHMAFGSSHRLGASTSFQLASREQLPSAQVHIGPLSAQGNVGASAQITAALRNTGTAPDATTIALKLYRLTDGLPGRQPIATRRLSVRSLKPRHNSRLHAGIGHLVRGTYRLMASYTDTNGTPQTLVADF
jgi:hypothetical protein